MPKYGKKSKERLATVHQDLQTLFWEVIKHRDCYIVSGLRTQEEQAALYAKGRTVPGDIITYKDGIDRRSKHQSGMAVDVVPWPEKWDKEALRDFGNFVKGIAVMMKRYNTIEHDIKWGGDWTNFVDMPHWEI